MPRKATIVSAQPPQDDGLGENAIGCLSKVFEHSAASYKYLWTLALLNYIEYNDECAVSNELLVKSMLREAVFPIRNFKLNFGPHDRIEERLKSLAVSATDNTLNLETADPKIIRKVCDEMTAKVPHRWLQPFFGDEEINNPTRAERVVKEATTRFAEQRFNTANPPPYKLSKNGIVLHPRWHGYFRRHAKILRGWILWHWTNFLQARNPNIPAIANKIGFPESRAVWQKEPEFWRRVLKCAPDLRCIYSGKQLTADFALDHFVPWSFIGHNRPWNVAPVNPSANSQKSDSLPHTKYLLPFAKFQSGAMEIRARHFPNSFEKLTEAYYADLKLPQADLTNAQKLQDALIKTITPLMDIAKNNGFKHNWIYQRHAALNSPLFHLAPNKK